jgi:5-formyltetrahydrofolate cyclo-ligase
MTKDEHRRLAAQARRDAAAADPEASGRLLAHWPLGRVEVLALYRPIRDELDPIALTAVAERVALPVTPPKGFDAPLAFRLWSPGEPLIRSGFGVPEPGPQAPEVRPDVIVTPLLAYTGGGGRLGWGKGHFDRTLRSLRATGSVVAIGLAYAAQRRDDLPLEAHDEPLDGVLTETGYLPVQKVF